MLAKIKKAALSPVSHFVLLRYLGLIIQFVNAVVIAQLLGSFYFGVYGFITMALQYLSYSNGGVGYSLNVLLALKKSNEMLAEKIWKNSILFNHIVTLVILLLGMICWYTNPGFVQKYSFRDYVLPVAITAVLVNYNTMYMNLYRIYGSLKEINIFQILPQVFTLLLFPFFREKELLVYWVWGNLTVNFLSFILFTRNAHFPFKIAFGERIFYYLVSKGFHLLLYNISFYFIALSARTFISYFYSVEELGYFSFANMLANSVQLAGSAFLFLFFPKIINKLGLSKEEEVVELISRVKLMYVNLLTTLILMLIVAVCLAEGYVAILTPTKTSIITLLAAQILLIGNIGNSSFLIARKKETNLTKVGFASVAIVLMGSGVAYLTDAGITGVALAVLIACAAYCILVHWLANRQLSYKLKGYFSSNWRELLSVVILSIGCLLQIEQFFYLALGAYLIFNASGIFKSVRLIESVLLSDRTKF